MAVPIVRRRTAALAAAGALVASGLAAAAMSITPASAATAGCSVTYGANSWGNGFTANITVTNSGPALSSWTLGWTFAGNQQVTQGWSGTFTQSAKHVTVKNASYNGSLGTNASTSLGFNGSYSGTNAAPTSFKLNGTTCDGSTGSDPTQPPPGNGGCASSSICSSCCSAC